MDRISFLSDDVLLHLLSLLTTKDVLKTSVLSKRWRNLWKLVPKLEYIDCDKNDDHGRSLLFVDRSLLLNRSPVLDSLRFKFHRQCSNVDIGFWVRIAVERGLRDFDFYHPIFNEPSRLPQSLFTCGTLVVLKLTNVSLADVKFPVSFSFLKTLHLGWVIYLDDESPQKILSSCPILEDLVVNRDIDDNVTTTFSITVPSLQKLFYNGKSGALENESEFALNAPLLKCLEILDGSYECKIEEMPEIMAANVEVIYWNTDNLLGSLTSLKRLSLCLPMESSFPIGKIFHQLVDLEFCTCELEWDVLMYLLKDSPKLRALKLNERHNNVLGNRRRRWDEPSSVPETLMFGLQTLEWRNYRGWYLEKELATFILKHSCCLKTASFSPVVTTLEKQHRMLTELALLSRGSTTCQLVFD